MKVRTLAILAIPALLGLVSFTTSGVSAASPSFSNVSVSVSGLPSGRSVEVWAGSQRIANVASNITAEIKVPRGVKALEAIVSPTLKREYNTKVHRWVTVSTTPGVRFVSTQAKYVLASSTSPSVISLHFKKEYEVYLGSWIRVQGVHLNAAKEALGLIHMSPASRWFDAGQEVHLSAANGSGMQFAYWIEKDASSGNIVSHLSDFSSAKRTLTLHMNGPKSVVARYVGDWNKTGYRRGGKAITVSGLVPGQRVEVLHNGHLTAVAKAVSKIGQSKVKASIIVPSSGYKESKLAITAPDGSTIIFSSPTYSILKGGDSFFY